MQDHLSTPHFAVICNTGHCLRLLDVSLSTGKGPLCAINRSSIFFLLAIQIHLCDLTRLLYVSIKVETKQSQGLIWKVLSAGIPCLLMAISYAGFFFFDFMHGWMSWGGSRMVASRFLNDKKTRPYQLNAVRTVRQARTTNSMW